VRPEHCWDCGTDGFPYDFHSHIKLNVSRDDVLFAASGYVKVNRCSVLYTSDGMVIHQACFLDASLRRLKCKEIQFRIRALAQTPVDECHQFSLQIYHHLRCLSDVLAVSFSSSSSGMGGRLLLCRRLIDNFFDCSFLYLSGRRLYSWVISANSVTVERQTSFICVFVFYDG